MTLVEILIVMAIFAALVGILIWNFNRYRQNDHLRQAAEGLAADIKSAQTYSLSGKTIQVPGEPNEAVPIGGYGVHFDLNFMGNASYLIFADRERYNGGTCEAIRDFRYTYGYCAHLCTMDNNNDDYALPPQVITLPDDIIISNIVIDSISQNIVDITFFPPQSRVRLGKGLPCGAAPEVVVDNVEITLHQTVTGLEKIVKVIGASGQISVISP